MKPLPIRTVRARDLFLGGFSLVEVLVALSLGLMVVGFVADVLLIQSGQARRLGRLLHEQLVGQRALTLIAGEVQQAEIITQSTSLLNTKGCALVGRRVQLGLKVPAGDIVYSVEMNPSSIWRGSVLMRCGPAYGVDGVLRSNTRQSSVLVDAVASHSLMIKAEQGGVLLQLERSFIDGGDKSDSIKVQLFTFARAAIVD